MDLLESLFGKAAESPAAIVYAEGGDARVVAAAARSAEMGIARPILVGDSVEIGRTAEQGKVSLEQVRVVSPQDPDRLGAYAADYAASRGVREAVAVRVVRKPLAFAGMMVKRGEADGMVAGAASATASVIQAAALTVGYRGGFSTPSSLFVMMIPNLGGEQDKVLVFADCAVNVSPGPRTLAETAVASAHSAATLLGLDPKVAFLSFSTKGSASHEDVDKVVEAVRIAREIEPDLDMDGELQADAALVPAVAEKKVKESRVAGRANVLIFPDLDAANIAYKLVQYTAGAKAVGPIMQGFAKPVNDLSRGATVDDLVAVTAITSVQAADVEAEA